MAAESLQIAITLAQKALASASGSAERTLATPLAQQLRQQENADGGSKSAKKVSYEEWRQRFVKPHEQHHHSQQEKHYKMKELEEAQARLRRHREAHAAAKDEASSITIARLVQQTQAPTQGLTLPNKTKRRKKIQKTRKAKNAKKPR